MTTNYDDATTFLDARAAATGGGRLIALSGLVYVLAWIVGLIIGFATSSPSPSDSTQVIGDYFASHREAAMLQAYLVDGVAGVALLVFASALQHAMRRLVGTGAALANILFGLGIAAAAVSLLQGLFTQVLADRVAKLGDEATIRALYDLNTQGDTYKLLALGLFLGTATLLIFRTRAVPLWLGWLGAVLGPLLIIAGWSFLFSTSAQYAAYTVLLPLLLIWVAGVSVTAWRRGL